MRCLKATTGLTLDGVSVFNPNGSKREAYSKTLTVCTPVTSIRGDDISSRTARFGNVIHVRRSYQGYVICLCCNRANVKVYKFHLSSSGLTMYGEFILLYL